MFSFAIVAKLAFSFERTIVHHMTEIKASKTNKLLRALFWVMLRRKADIAGKFVQAGKVVVTNFFASETFDILWKVSEFTKKIPEESFLVVINRFWVFFLLAFIVFWGANWLIRGYFGGFFLELSFLHDF